MCLPPEKFSSEGESTHKFEDVSCKETRSLLSRVVDGHISGITAEERITALRLADKCKRDQGLGQGEVRALLQSFQWTIKIQHGFMLPLTLLAAVLVGNLGEEQIQQLIVAAGAENYDRLHQLEQVGCVLEVVSSSTGIGGYAGAGMLIKTFMKELAPLQRGEINAFSFGRIFSECVGGHGGKLYAAIHAKRELPDILVLPKVITDKLSALRVSTEALKQMRGEQLAQGNALCVAAAGYGKRQQEPSAISDERPSKQVSVGPVSAPTDGAASGPSGVGRACNTFLLNGTCSRALCSYNHVVGRPGVDKCPFGASCNRKEKCLLAWSHP